MTYKFMIVPAALQHDVRETQRQRAIGAGLDLQPDIGAFGHPCATRIDHDQTGPAFQGFQRSRGMTEAGQVGVVAPEQNTARSFQV